MKLQFEAKRKYQQNPKVCTEHKFRQNQFTEGEKYQVKGS